RDGGRGLQDVAALAGREAVIHAAFHFGQFNHGIALFVEQSQIAVIIYGPARNIFRRWKQTRTVFLDIEPAAARSSLAPEAEAADFVMVGIGKFPGADHRSRGVLRLGRRLWILRLGIVRLGVISPCAFEALRLS